MMSSAMDTDAFQDGDSGIPMPPLPVFDDVTFDGVFMDRINNLINTFLHPNDAKFIHPQLVNIFFRSKLVSVR